MSNVNYDVKLMLGLVAAAVVLGAASPAAGVPSVAPTSLPLPVRIVRRDLAARLEIPVSRVRVVRTEARVWPDGCLGLPSPEFCAPRPTPGFLVTLAARCDRYRYRTDRHSAFRFVGKVPRR
jgi:hypothetical protein